MKPDGRYQQTELVDAHRRHRHPLSGVAPPLLVTYRSVAPINSTVPPQSYVIGRHRSGRVLKSLYGLPLSAARIFDGQMAQVGSNYCRTGLDRGILER